MVFLPVLLIVRNVFLNAEELPPSWERTWRTSRWFWRFAPELFALLHKLAIITEGANCNAAGTAVMRC